jgi:site-specific recombinase XerD
VVALPVVQRALTIPTKRHDQPIVGFLSSEEIEAVLAAPPRGTWIGERDFALLSTAYNTGARVSELVGLRVQDVELDRAPSVRIMGKGRKLRQVPLWKSTATTLRQWIKRRDAGPTEPVFPNRRGEAMTRSNVEKRMKIALRVAAKRCPSLGSRRASPHTLRHTTAMHLLQSGVDLATIALWLGHASLATTHTYVEADLAMRRGRSPSSPRQIPGPLASAPTIA